MTTIIAIALFIGFGFLVVCIKERRENVKVKAEKCKTCVVNTVRPTRK